MEKLGNIFIIIIATVLMQYHGIMFWVSIVGNTGIAWSIALEASALWLWFYSDKNHALAIIASALLLLGPLYHIASPVFETTQQQEIAEISRSSSIELLKKDIESIEASLVNALENSKTRAGWLGEIQESKNSLSEKRLQLATLIQQQAPPQYIRQWLITGIQAAALLLVWLVSVYAIKALAKSLREQIPQKRELKNKTDKPTNLVLAKEMTTPEHVLEEKPDLESRVVNALKKHLKDKNLTQTAWGKQVGISRNNVSLMMNHKKRLVKNMSTAPKKQFIKAAQSLGLKMEKNEYSSN